MSHGIDQVLNNFSHTFTPHRRWRWKMPTVLFSKLDRVGCRSVDVFDRPLLVQIYASPSDKTCNDGFLSLHCLLDRHLACGG